MIKYNSNTINDWNFDASNVIKVYRNNAIVFYKVSGESPTPEYKVCFAVVKDISVYQDTEFEDVYDKATEKWYKLNNLNQYEEYGVYGDGRNITYYQGKLTIDNGYEYEWNGSSWVNLGEVSGFQYPKYYTEKSAPLDNLTFNTLQEAETYAYNNCVYDGMKATIDGENYMFDSEYGWVEKTYSLPNVPFMLNYNAKEYDASTNTLPKTEGQLRNSDAVCKYGYHIVDHSSDGYITVTGNTRMVISGTPYFNRTNTRTGCTMTIVSKVKTTDVVESYSILTNRGNYSTMNWMWRYPSNAIFLHGSSSYNNPKYFTSTTEKPIIASIRINYDDSLKQLLNDWTNNGSYNGAFQYGQTYNGNNAMFCDYAGIDAEFWKGDFYWVYMSFNVLTDEQIQQVIDYNENL